MGNVLGQRLLSFSRPQALMPKFEYEKAAGILQYDLKQV